jgi:hypothetical protein
VLIFVSIPLQGTVCGVASNLYSGEPHYMDFWGQHHSEWEPSQTKELSAVNGGRPVRTTCGKVHQR